MPISTRTIVAASIFFVPNTLAGRQSCHPRPSANRWRVPRSPCPEAGLRGTQVGYGVARTRCAEIDRATRHAT
jgi:hypothetical protein